MNELINNLKQAGLKSTDTVIVHSSCKKINRDANLIIDSLMEYFKDGLLVIPTHTWKNVNEENNVFDVNKTESCLGIIPNLFMKRPNVYRSLHPTHSVAAYGKDSPSFIKDEEKNTTPASPGGVYDKLRLRNGYVLLIGVGNERNTYIHAIEELLVIPNRLAKDPIEYKIIDNDKEYKAYVRKHYNCKQMHISEDFVKLDKALYTLGAIKDYQFGDAKMMVCDTVKLYEIIRHILAKRPECIVDDAIIDDSLWQDLV